MYTSNGNRVLVKDQEAFVRDLLDEADMLDCAPKFTPMVPGQMLAVQAQTDADRVFLAEKGLKFSSILGKVGWLAVKTRPDLGYAYAQLAQFAAPTRTTREAYEALVYLLRYLRASILMVQVVGDPAAQTVSAPLVAFVDASWAQGACARAPWCVAVFAFGSLVAFRTRAKQSVTPSSTALAELDVMFQGRRILVSVRRCLRELTGSLPATPMRLARSRFEQRDLVASDSLSALSWTAMSRHTKGNRHYGVRYQELRSALRNGEVEYVFCPGSEQVADIGTKALGRVLFARMRSGLGLVRLDLGRSNSRFRMATSEEVTLGF